MSDFLIIEKERLQAEIRSHKRVLLDLRYRLRHNDLTDEDRDDLQMDVDDAAHEIEILKLDIADIDQEIREQGRIPEPIPITPPEDVDLGAAGGITIIILAIIGIMLLM